MGCENCGFNKLSDDQMLLDDAPSLEYDSCGKLNAYDWLNDLPDSSESQKIVELRFKNTRKEFFENSNNLQLSRGSTVVVEAQSGYDVGVVSLLGTLAQIQFKKKVKHPDKQTFRKIYRHATATDLTKWKDAKNAEHSTMLKARTIAMDLNLDMKISDVEYQGDKSKATFYYIADKRVDFRELIKLLAREFGIRIEMKQIGSRQEAARIGGIGSCGRELCCSTWRTNLASVSLNAAKYQDLPLNVQKLAGKCGKLKCCLMYELDYYLEAWQEFPQLLLELETKKGIAYRNKVDVLKKIVYYTYTPDSSENLIPVTIEKVKEIIMLNKKGIQPEDLSEFSVVN